MTGAIATHSFRRQSLLRICSASTRLFLAQMAEDEQQENSGSGWGWGWLSEAAKVAQEAYENNVKPTLVSMESTTSQFGTCRW